ncbi:hypothetical protein Pcinc_028294 [Petrolisthes cinctipes]|uniref:Pre-rRNA-processing protein Ipi1 N-terminal domain-containing protein n=1 Tax=Petrolisthes cinctipes TaxID=88211 RepID=A0AAE1F3G0_PETCI|nr:hypothetical protein Pcinc_028294 [Petrolisthes cinctipes]
MAKSARAKKAKKADFAKVKIKVGKKLKKAQNETKTDFKARKIIVAEQLARKTNETVLTKKMHNIKDLLSRLQHNNTYVRQDGINGLLELVKNKDCDLLVPHLSVMVGGAAPCMFDSDALIRSTTNKFIEALITKVGVHLEPYMNVIATHLSCAMVHLNMHVQGDSLKVMNLLVTRCPALMARHASTLLTNFLNLISRKAKNPLVETAEKKNSVGLVDFRRVLLDSPSNTMTATKWRIRLLQELSAFMEAVLAEQNCIEYHIPLTTWQSVTLGSLAPVATYDGVQGSIGGQVSLFSDTQQLATFVHSVVPLLFQVWAEVEPSSNEHSQGSNIINEEATETLTCIVSIITQLWKAAHRLAEQTSTECNWFLGELKSKFQFHIMRWFPCYRRIDVSDKKKKRGDDYGLQYCDNLNLSMAALALQFSFSRSLYDRASSFLAKLLRDRNRDGEYQLASLVEVVLAVLIPSPTTRNSDYLPPSTPASLLDGSFTCYARLHPLKKDRSQLLRILLAATNIDNKHIWECEQVESWIKLLVTELAEKVVTEGVVEAAIILGLRGNSRFRLHLTPRKEHIQENLRKRGVPGWSIDKVNLKLKFVINDEKINKFDE